MNDRFPDSSDSWGEPSRINWTREKGNKQSSPLNLSAYQAEHNKILSINTWRLQIILESQLPARFSAAAPAVTSNLRSVARSIADSEERLRKRCQKVGRSARYLRRVMSWSTPPSPSQEAAPTVLWITRAAVDGSWPSSMGEFPPFELISRFFFSSSLLLSTFAHLSLLIDSAIQSLSSSLSPSPSRSFRCHCGGPSDRCPADAAGWRRRDDRREERNTTAPPITTR